ncbi:M28 family peptidase [Fulvivirga sp. RKSG066]|uniref:M28 family peptidase n=1 Tax=Fulvivirga aurantia TaxID=2529383 RepID=UPI0012BD1CDE|nr:M28 family peptidase [Fulvivirga aurantia]MTI21986.1 M28 family peptidase [Fulvivirga aurantia]
MKKFLICIVGAFLAVSTYAQSDDPSVKFAETITQDDMYENLSILASDALEGRETGERGQKMAAAFIASQFQEMGLQGPVANGGNSGFYQGVTLYTVKPGDIYAKSKDQQYANFEGVVYYGKSATDGEKTKDIVFVGAGTEEDFKNVDVKGKAVLAIVANTRAWRGPAELAEKNGAEVLFAVNTASDEEFDGLNNQLKHYLSGGSLSVQKPAQEGGASFDGVFFVKPSLAGDIFKTKIEKLRASIEDGKVSKATKPAKISYNISTKVEEMQTENVLGYLEGSDLKDELVVLTAHYDHVGVDGEEVYNGADDDGSGTSAVIEIAEAFVEAKKAGKGPRRSMLFMLVTGEEKGLLGSEYYAENPVFPLENTIVDLNIDMIGRVDEKHEANPNYVYLVGADRLSSELHEISEKVNETYTQFDLDYTYNDENHPDRIYYRSDHWNFAKNNVPIIFYFNGVHADYHKPTDTIDKINFELLTKRAQLVFHTAWVLSNRDQRPVVDKLQDQKVGSN